MPAPLLNGEPIDGAGYAAYHARRIERTLEMVARLGKRRIVEVGGHPWAMSQSIVEDPRMELVATVSAEEVARWPDDIGVTREAIRLVTRRGCEGRFVNYSANVERTLFELEESVDVALACEVVEHLIRSPHILFLNLNHWLPQSGTLLVTTPNGAQFANPLRRGTRTPAYRSQVYERHSYVYTLEMLKDLIELCGFEVVDAGYWNVYQRDGLARVYDWASRLPGSYWREKFKRTLFVVARKRAHITQLPRSPRVYDPRGSWELIADPSPGEEVS